MRRSQVKASAKISWAWFNRQISKGGNTLLNYCFVSGEVVSEPEIKRYDDQGATTFEMAVAVGHLRAGVVRVTCYLRLAVVAAKHIHKGDRVAVMGHLVWYLNETQERQILERPEIMALDLEFLKDDSPVLGLVFKDTEEEKLA